MALRYLSLPPMIEWLTGIDRAILFAINSWHPPLLDWLMWEISGKYLAAIFYLSLAYLIYKKFGRKAAIPIVMAAALFAITDQTSGICKKLTKRERPTHNEVIADKIQTVMGEEGGTYGFFSSHAANSFCMCTFCFLLLRRRLKGMRWIFVFAALHSLSRVYMGLHYPSDILVGAIYGALWGWLGFAAIKRYAQFIPVKPRAESPERRG